jgi:hypothetical protein
VSPKPHTKGVGAHDERVRTGVAADAKGPCGGGKGERGQSCPPEQRYLHERILDKEKNTIGSSPVVRAFLIQQSTTARFLPRRGASRCDRPNARVPQASSIPALVHPKALFSVSAHMRAPSPAQPFARSQIHSLGDGAVRAAPSSHIIGGTRLFRGHRLISQGPAPTLYLCAHISTGGQ